MQSRSVMVLVLAAAALALLGAACGDDDDADSPATATKTAGASGATTTAAPDGDVTIKVADNKFEPATATIKVNQEIIWEWSGSNPHSVVGTYEGIKQPESVRLTGSGTFVLSFSKPGTLTYQCGVHGASMSGKVTIVE